MSEGKWSGGVANRTWARTRGRVTDLAGDSERGPRLYEPLAGERFWCEVCGRSHALREHRVPGVSVTARMVVAAAAAGVIIAAVILLALAWIGPPT